MKSTPDCVLSGKSLYRGKGIVPHVQLTAKCGLSCLLLEKNISQFTNRKFCTWDDNCTSGRVTFPLFTDESKFCRVTVTKIFKIFQIDPNKISIKTLRKDL